MQKTEKQQVVDQLQEVFDKNAAVLLLDFTGLNVADETELRGQIAEVGRYQVVKNTLALRASENTAVADLRDHFQGPTAIAYSDGDPVGLAKTLTEFLKAHPTMTFKAGVVDKQAVTAEQVKELADMPSREELLSKLVYLLQSPLSSLASALQSPLRSLAGVLAQIEETKS